jgi:hypothetical protein
MTCQPCNLSKQQPKGGVYNFMCLNCCARLVLSAQPDKRLAMGMLEAIRRFDGPHGRAAILGRVSQMLTKHPSASQNAGMD